MRNGGLERGNHRKPLECRAYPIERRLPRVEPHVRRDLIVAAARRMQAPAGVADELDQPGLHVHVNVFERRIHLARLRGELVAHTVEPTRDGIRVRRGDQAACGQHAGVGLAATHVVIEQAVVEVG